MEAYREGSPRLNRIFGAMRVRSKGVAPRAMGDIDRQRFPRSHGIFGVLSTQTEPRGVAGRGMVLRWMRQASIGGGIRPAIYRSC